MPASIVYGDQTIPYQVNHDDRRTTRVAIHVDPDGSVVVDAPPGFDDAAVNRAVQKRARWVAGHVEQAKARYANVRPREYVSGEQLFYLGRRYMLKVQPVDGRAGPVKLKGNCLIVETRGCDPDDIKGRLRGWYRVKARDYFAQKISMLSARLPWVKQQPSFRLLAMEKQWGSCTASGQLLLNPHLIKAPRECIEYVIAHELAHLKHHDHGPEFWNLIDNAVPGWGPAKKKLDAMVETLTSE